MMTVAMRVMSAGKGYEYLLRTVAVGDGDRSLVTPLTRYYSAEGTPPGRWMGAGLSSIGNGQILVGDTVSEEQLQLLVGMGCDPITKAPLGRAYPVYKSVAERAETRTAALSESLTPVERGLTVAAIEAEEAARGMRKAVAGFDSPSRYLSRRACSGQWLTRAHNQSSPMLTMRRL